MEYKMLSRPHGYYKGSITDLAQPLTALGRYDQNHYVLAIPKSTNTQYQSTKDTLKESKIMETLQKSTLNNSQTSTASLAVFLARHFLSLDAGGGFNDTRGTFFFDLARILRTKQPRLFVFENVKGLLNHDGGRTFATIIQTIDELGYDVQWQVLNSKNRGVPQNRERVIIVGNLRGASRPEVFPIGGYDKNTTVEDSKIRPVAQTVRAQYGRGGNGLHVGTLRTHKDGNGFREMQSGVAPTIPARAREDGSGQAVVLTSMPTYGNGERSIEHGTSDTVPTIRASHHKGGDNNPKIVVPVLTPDRINKRQNGRRFKDDGEPQFTLTGQDKHGVFDGEHSIRRLTPKECERLQAFPDNWTEYGYTWITDSHGLLHQQLTPISDTQRYKMCGNAVTTNVIQDVFEEIFR